MVTGANKGIQHVFRITSDRFATGNNTKLVNNKEYYYICVAYAHNRYKEYSQTDAAKLDGQKEPYLAGRKNENGGPITAVKAIPHDPAAENGGTVAQAQYGLCPNITRIEGYGNGGFALKLSEKSLNELMGEPGQEGKAPGTFTERTTGGTYSANIDNPCIIANPLYEQNAGPVNVKVIDPLNIKPGKFYIQFTGIDNDARWVISRVDGQPLYDNVLTDTSDFIIGRYNEQLFLDLGISVGISNPIPVASSIRLDNSTLKPARGSGIVNDGTVLYSAMTFADNNKQWLSGIPDNDNYMVYNWVRSGSQYAENALNQFKNGTTNYSLAEAYLDEDYYRATRNNTTLRMELEPLDKYQVFEKVVGGLWAPYAMTSSLEFHPAFSFRYFVSDSTILDSLRRINTQNARTYKNYFSTLRNMMDYTTNKSIAFNDMSKLPSVRIVLTADQSKWTRCPVLEMCDDYTQSEGNAHRFQMRKHASVDKNGDTATTTGASNDPNSPNYISDRGMGWFPGYAISLETGERLNIMFGEDSRYVQYNGRDMMWNPVSTVQDGTQNYVMGGRHFIYIMNAMNQNFPRYHANSSTIAQYCTPSYDAGRWAVRMLRSLDRILATTDANATAEINRGLLKSESSKFILPQRDSSAFLFSTVAWVNMPLVSSRYVFDNPRNIPCDVTIDINVNRQYGKYLGDNETKLDTINSNNPMFMFELTDDIATLTGQATKETAEKDFRDSILSMIGVVPNPYYSYATYETASQLETKVRFINVPANSTISIYTVDGTLVRRLGPTPSNTTTYDWDLHNHNGIPIAGGMYLIHFHAEGIGDRVVKWFGTMRPVDLNSFQF